MYLTSSIPETIGNLTRLVVLYLTFNNLTGTIPREIGNLALLEVLALYSNQLNGGVPDSIAQLSNLQFLFLDSNRFSGSIPQEIWRNLIHVDLSNNNFSGGIPTTVCKATSLDILELSNAYTDQCSSFDFGPPSAAKPFKRRNSSTCSHVILYPSCQALMSKELNQQILMLQVHFQLLPWIQLFNHQTPPPYGVFISAYCSLSLSLWDDNWFDWENNLYRVWKWIGTQVVQGLWKALGPCRFVMLS
ncbi:hypothetical protein POM88_006367 [Heracleum sosnowskyi]|uniref:Non-specific serine/threonine protein kinase n=1 Tax=Heracleum sosnowskyi TaxID=360622 RepID=A0AAD8J2L4_9APIA|nr:hypothetical protein POM88_006367 [Heracleum sosnowskyi]